MKKSCLIIILLCFIITFQLLATGSPNKTGFSQDSLTHLDIPDRPQDAIEGSEFVNQITGLSIRKREIAIVEQILSGNVPDFSRKLTSITLSSDNHELTFYTVNDYLAIGSQEDYIYIPMMPSTAQHLADQLNCSLPTKKLVDIIYSRADIKLDPQPISWSEENITVPVFMDHTDLIKQQLQEKEYNRPLDSLIAGHKKDIIISKKIYSNDRDYDRVVIYGWHRSEGDPIQPVYNGHSSHYADYSHGVRLLSKIVSINGEKDSIQNVLKDADLASILSSEGVINKPYYPDSDWFVSIQNRSANLLKSLKLYQNYPNPFNPSTTIKYGLPKGSHVRISIYNLNGELIKTLIDNHKSAGYHKSTWNARDVPTGVYFYQIKADKFTDVKKCILIK
jgi:hypothetical protein